MDHPGPSESPSRLNSRFFKKQTAGVLTFLNLLNTKHQEIPMYSKSELHGWPIRRACLTARYDTAEAVPLVLLDHQLADFYYCISLLKIVRTVSYHLYTIVRYFW